MTLLSQSTLESELSCSRICAEFESRKTVLKPQSTSYLEATRYHTKPHVTSWYSSILCGCHAQWLCPEEMQVIHASFWLCMFKGSLSTLLSHHIKCRCVHKKIAQLKVDLFVEGDYS
ncbi:UNVERIFIED_CONTAM: hypothetical protein K2H54_060600 [Gekko kuhli]